MELGTSLNRGVNRAVTRNLASECFPLVRDGFAEDLHDRPRELFSALDNACGM